MKICTICKYENPVEAKFCRHCGNVFKDAEMPRETDSTIIKERDFLRGEVKQLQQEIKKINFDKQNTSSKNSNRKLHVVYLVLLVLFTILGGSIGGILHYVNSKYYYTEYHNLSEFVEEYSKYKPFDIVSIDIRNEGQEYGADIYSKNTTYINPRICIAGLESGSYTFQVKFYNRYGDLSQGKNSPTNYSYEEECYINAKEIQHLELSGWGGKEQGHWDAGNYCIEIWYKNNKIAQKHFQIYDEDYGTAMVNDSIAL